ncbi:M61 family metallopeptidase [Pontibacter qinzhouensis]|uniref:M61 family metallopeptidase n=2 Tax=Pontibacter qinzhouensis TaxID=2603253 RepID=A0A5C8KEV2_9BACT|nr:M61 family metallopeptidase [Pontibacter qinzhouensis]
MPEPHTHYFEVELHLKGTGRKGHIDYKMPVWAPGSYLIREFPKNVEGFVATDKAGKNLRAEKIDKNTWRVYSQKASEVKVKYKVYAFELSVRTSFIDASHGYVNGTSVFMYPEGYQKQSGELVVKPYKDWSKVSTGLTSTGNFTYTFPDYDVLADSPLEIGNHEVLTFTAAGVPHEVAMYGPGNFVPDRLLADMKKVTETAVAIFGELPVKRYVFIVHNLQRSGGGLEHLNSTTLQTTSTSYGTESGYNGFLNLVAHEYFHLWNVKRLRPEPLGPFDYSQENYTTLLWVAEGFTSYYSNVICLRAGIITPQKFLDTVSGSIHAVENTPGNKVQTVSEASFDAWIKSYRPNENSRNTEVSYYTKGTVLGHLLNMELMNATNGAKNLDDVMQYMYNRYYKQLNRGYTEQEVKQALELVAGKKLDDFFRDYINGTKTPDYNCIFEAAGLQLVNLNAGNNQVNWGATASPSDGKLIVRSLTRGSSAWQAGINVQDELLAIEGTRVASADEVTAALANYELGDRVQVLVNRSGKLQTLEVLLLKDESVRYRFERVEAPTSQQQQLFEKWLHLK